MNHRTFILLLALVVVPLAKGCDAARPDIDTEGLGRLCPPETECREGQECITTEEGPNAGLSTCEIRCQEDQNCPAGYRCNNRNAVPDSLPFVCVED
jgi:hypothetical protein